MYSYEMKQYLHERNNVLSREEYLEFTDVKKQPQICSMKYNTYDDTYEVETSDGYYFNFMVLRDE